MLSKRVETALLVSVGAILALARLPGLRYIENTLWAEDGSLFFAEAAALGVKSFLSSYAGYLTLYPRLVSLVSLQISITWTPYLYFCGWLLACSVLIHVIVKRAQGFGAGALACAGILAAIILQPNYGDVFYNITNAQWLLASAMCIWALGAPDDEKVRWWEIAGFAICALTGPILVFLIPAMVLRAVLVRDMRCRASVYVVLFTCAAIQLYFVYHSNRIQSIPLDRNLGHWLEAARTFLAFGVDQQAHILAGCAVAFWLLLVVAFLGVARRPGDRFQALALFGTGLLIFLAGLLAKRDNPLVLNPLFDGSRYYFPAYSLIFFSACAATREARYLRGAVFVLLVVIAGGTFKKVGNPDLHWHAYATFATRMSGISIPVNPQNPEYPSWHLAVPDRYLTGQRPQTHDAEMTGWYDVASRIDMRFVPLTAYPYLTFAIPESCRHRRHLALDVDISRDDAGIAKFFWRGSAMDFKEDFMNRRYFNAGRARMFFAVENDMDVVELRLDPLTANPFEIHAAHIYCED